MKHSIILIYFELNIWPVATAPGSDRPLRLVYLLFVQSPERKDGLLFTAYSLVPL